MLLQSEGCVLQSEASLGRITTRKQCADHQLINNRPYNIAPNHCVLHTTYPLQIKGAFSEHARSATIAKRRTRSRLLLPQNRYLVHRGVQHSTASILSSDPPPWSSRFFQALTLIRCKGCRIDRKPFARRMHAALTELRR